MRFTNLRKPTLAVVMALLVVLSAGAAAAVTFDTESVSSATTSDVSGASNNVNLYPGNSTETLYVETDGAGSENLTLELSPATVGVNHTVYTNATPDTVNASMGHYAWTIGHDELENIPRDTDGGTYNLTVTNDTSGKEVLNTEVVFATPDDDTVVMSIADGSGSDASAMTNLIADRVTIESEDGGLFGVESLSWGEANDTTISTWSGYTTVNGTASDVTISLDNESTADAYASAAEDYDDGDAMTSSTIWINGVPHLVYKNEVPDDLEDNTTTVVYSESTDELQIDLNGEEYEGIRTVSMQANAGTGYTFGELWSNFGAGTALRSATNI